MCSWGGVGGSGVACLLLRCPGSKGLATEAVATAAAAVATAVAVAVAVAAIAGANVYNHNSNTTAVSTRGVRGQD